MNKQEQDKQIIEGAPDQDCYFQDGYYFRIVGSTLCVFDTEKQSWFSAIFDGFEGRSLSDIRELVALRDEVAKYQKAEKALRDLDKYLGIGGDV